MIYKYNNFALSDLGDLTVSQTREYEGGDSPQRCKVTHRVTIELFQRSYADNYSLIQQANEALRTQQAWLFWQNEANQNVYVNQTATLASHDLPEEWGQYHQTLHLSFFYYEQDFITQNLPLVFTANGVGGSPINLANVTKWNEGGTTERYSPLHSQRKIQKGKVSVGGFILGDTTLPLVERRATLITQEAILKKQMTSADGVLAFGSGTTEVFNQVVRIEAWESEIDQLTCCLRYTFTATYTLFPDETNYALVEFTAELNDPNPNAGEQFLTLAGKITAQNETAARAKMESVTATVLAQYQYAAGQKLNFRSTASNVIADKDGSAFLELNFNGQWRKWCASNQKATFQRSGSGNAVSFGNTTKWNLHYAARRFTDLRSQREQAGGTIEASGTWAGDPALSLDQRRSQLLAQQQAMLTEVNKADGTLKYGSWSQVVRIADLKADINQAVTGIDWSFTATWTLFPNEAGYATAEFSADYQTNVETGDALLTLEGRIFAPDESLAQAELNRLRASMLETYGFDLTQQLRTKVTANRVYANGDKTAALGSFEDADGTTFTELTFSEEYRQRMVLADGHQVLSDTLQVLSRDDTTTNQVITTYTGTVIAGGDFDAAYALALQRAQALGANKEVSLGANAFLRSSQIDWEQRRTQADAAVEFVRLSFAFEYQGKLAAGRAYIEVNANATQDTFGTDTLAVSGFVAATDLATAQQLYQSQVRALYKTALVHNESTSQGQLIANADAASPRGQFLKLDFNFQIYQSKPTGRVAYRYGLNVRKDFLTLKLETHIKGSVFAFNRVAADAALASLLKSLQSPTSSQVAEELNEDREYMSDLSSGADADVFLKLDFDEAFEDRLTGLTGVLEMSLSQQIKYSGTRWIPQPLPFDANGSGGVTIVQPGGIQEGGQTIHGSVTAPDQATAIAWAKAQRSLLIGDYPQPEEWDWDYEFVPRIQGVVKGANPNVRLYKLSFTFGEILPDYPSPT